MDGAGFGLAPALFAAGLATSAHCVGMCGGIVAAFSVAPAAPLHDRRTSKSGSLREWPRQVVFSAGRIASYSIAGAGAAALGASAAWAAEARGSQALVALLANAMLILLGLHLASGGRLLARFEAAGLPLWKRLAPYAARFSPGASLPHAFAAGMLWGWLPCGFVYGALATAVFAGGPAQGAAAMAAFGAGTLPGLLLAGIAAARLREWLGKPLVRATAGLLVLGFGAAGLARAAGIVEPLRDALLCF
jgi:sulfite exporter TauE/SafE